MTIKNTDILPGNVRDSLKLHNSEVTIYRLQALEQSDNVSIKRLPYSIRVLLENLLRHCCRGVVEKEDLNDCDADRAAVEA